MVILDASVFHSPCTRILLALMKSPLSKLPSMKRSPWDDSNELLGIVPMTEIRVIESGQQRRMVARYGDIVAAGRWSDCFLGSTSTSTQLSDGITVTNALLPLFN